MKTRKFMNISMALLAASMTVCAAAKDAKGLKVYINPGHGGHDADDRNVVIAPYAQGDPNGYWESNSNLSKGLQLRDMLEAKGYTVVMSRVTNTTADDLGLSTIVRLSNESNADIFFSIHSNATGVVARRNFPLMLFRGYDNGPEKPADKELCIVLNKYLLQNQATYWTSTAQNVRGDWTFYPQWNGAGLGVLRGNKVTAMLSEGSFHDYIPEAYRLMSDDFCWLEAWHFRKTVDEFLGVEGLTVGGICGRLNDNRVPREGDYIKFGDDLFATIQGATVELLDASGKVINTYKTDEVHTNGYYLFKDLQPGTYKIHASVPTHYDVTSDEIVVKADEMSYCNLQMAKVRSTPPVVESYSPVFNEGDEPVLCNTPVVLQFNWDMDMESTEKAFSINPPIDGTFTWEDLNYRMVFTPTGPYDINTVYTVTLSTEARHGGGMNMVKPFSFSFKTTDRNFMTILGSFPKQDEQVHYSGAVIEFRFDKFPNTTPILKQVTCTDSQGNAVAFNKRNMKNSKVGDKYGFFRIPFQNDLSIGETYNLQVSGEFADKDGITIQKPVNITFTAVDAAEGHDKIGIVDAMDNHEVYSYDESISLNVETAAVKKSTTNLFGSQAVAFSYTLAGEEGGEVRWNRAHIDDENATVINPGTKLGVHVYGDLTNNEVYLELTSDVSTLYVPICNMDFLGWRYIETVANVEGPSTITGVKLVQKASQMSHSGEFQMDRIISGDLGGVEDAMISDISVYPNPASEYIIANAGCMIENVELFSLNGLSIAKTAGNILNVSDIPAGTYLFAVTSTGGRRIHKVIIAH